MDKKQIKLTGGLGGGSFIITEDSIILSTGLFKSENFPYSEIEKVECVSPRNFGMGKFIIYAKTIKNPFTINFQTTHVNKFLEAKSYLEQFIGKKEGDLALQTQSTTFNLLVNNLNFYDNINKHYVVKYITGVPAYKKPDKYCTVHIEHDGIRLKKTFSPEAKLNWESIDKISADNRTQITRGVATGKAAVGLLLAGPFGALIGASVGTKHDDSICFVSITYKNELQEDALLLLQSDKAFEIVTVMNEARKGYLIKNGINQKKNKEVSTHISDNLDQLEKLASLKDKGIISQEEFDIKKKQLLGI